MDKTSCLCDLVCYHDSQGFGYVVSSMFWSINCSSVAELRTDDCFSWLPTVTGGAGADPSIKDQGQVPNNEARIITSIVLRSHLRSLPEGAQSQE